MTEPYKDAYTEMDSVAIMVTQDPPDQIHAPQHETYANEKHEPELVTCPECETAYAIGYPVLYGPTKPFEDLSRHLKTILMSDHRGNRTHRTAVSLG